MACCSRSQEPWSSPRRCASSTRCASDSVTRPESTAHGSATCAVRCGPAPWRARCRSRASTSRPARGRASSPAPTFRTRATRIAWRSPATTARWTTSARWPSTPIFAGRTGRSSTCTSTHAPSSAIAPPGSGAPVGSTSRAPAADHRRTPAPSPVTSPGSWARSSTGYRPATWTPMSRCAPPWPICTSSPCTRSPTGTDGSPASSSHSSSPAPGCSPPSSARSRSTWAATPATTTASSSRSRAGATSPTGTPPRGFASASRPTSDRRVHAWTRSPPPPGAGPLSRSSSSPAAGLSASSSPSSRASSTASSARRTPARPASRWRPPRPTYAASWTPGLLTRHGRTRSMKYRASATLRESVGR